MSRRWKRRGKGRLWRHLYRRRGGGDIATIAVGYADGYRRSLPRGSADPRHAGAGRQGICMDQCMVDVTEVAGAAPGDEVVLLGRQAKRRSRRQELAGRDHTIHYEVLTGIGARVERRFPMDKPALRAHFRALRGRMNSRLRDSLSMRACSRVLESSLWAKAGSVLLYAPSVRAGCAPVAGSGLAAGKDGPSAQMRGKPAGAAALPGGRMDRAFARSLGNWSPGEGCLCLPPEAVDLALVPVVANG